MEKSKDYTWTKFPFEVIKAVYNLIFKDMKFSSSSTDYSVSFEDEDWSYDTLDEFCAAYTKESCIYARLYLSSNNNTLDLNFSDNNTSVSIQSRLEIITQGFNVFESHAKKSKLPEPPSRECNSKPVVFIGHGRSDDWKIIKDDLRDKHNINVESFESGARAGHAIRDILEEMSNSSNFAILVLTAEDEQKDGGYRARQNVIHEAGLFQGKLGFNRAIIILQQGVEMPSNLEGIQQLRYEKKINEIIGDILATISREFPNAR